MLGLQDNTITLLDGNVVGSLTSAEAAGQPFELATERRSHDSHSMTAHGSLTIHSDKQ